MNTKIFFLICFFFAGGVAFGQVVDNTKTWDNTNKRWTGPNSAAANAKWTFTARTGYDNLTGTQYPPYYISTGANGFMEYLPAGYNLPANAQKRYPLVIYYPGCGETGNTGLFYTSGGQPVYSSGLGRLFGSSGTFNSLPNRILENGNYFSNIKFKRPGDGATGAVKDGNNKDIVEGMIIMCVNYLTTGFCSGAQPPSVFDVESTIYKAFSLYRVDPTKVFITGMSQGGPITWTMPTFSDGFARLLAATIPVCASETINNPINPAQEANAADILVRNGVNILCVSNRLDYENSPGARVHINNRESMLTIFANNNLQRPYQADTAFFTFTNQQAWLDNPTGPAPFRHDAWIFAYHPNVPEFSSSLLTTIQGNQKLWTDPVDGDTYNLFEWILTKQNLLLLPVRLTQFNAKRIDNGVQLDWTSALEVNASHFDVERSTDGRNFTVIGKVQASGNTNTNKDYRFQDLQVPDAKEVYYRLNQVDLDKKSDYSPTRKVLLSQGALNVRMYPNSTNGPVKIEFRASGQLTDLIVSDINGRVMLQRTIAPRQTSVSLDISAFARGIYVVKLQRNDDVETSKLVKY